MSSCVILDKSFKTSLHLTAANNAEQSELRIPQPGTTCGTSCSTTMKQIQHWYMQVSSCRGGSQPVTWLTSLSVLLDVSDHSMLMYLFTYSKSTCWNSLSHFSICRMGRVVLSCFARMLQEYKPEEKRGQNRVPEIRMQHRSLKLKQHLKVSLLQ